MGAAAFIPAVLCAPIGGVVADRVNKRNIMVVLDFSTAGLILAFTLLLDRAPLVPLMVACLMLLYGIAGAYQPSLLFLIIFKDRPSVSISPKRNCPRAAAPFQPCVSPPEDGGWAISAFVEPIVRQGMADGSIRTEHPRELRRSARGPPG